MRGAPQMNLYDLTADALRICAAPQGDDDEVDDTPMATGAGPDPSEMFAETGDY